MSYLTKLLPFILTILLPFLWAWLWFVPEFWELAEGSQDYRSAITSIFFENQGKEIFLGDTTDLQGTVWIFEITANVLEGKSNGILQEVYAPIGFDVGLNTGFAWADAVLAYPYVRFIGSPGFYNFHVLITLWINGIFLTTLFRQTRLSLLPSLGLSAMVLFTPFVKEELFHGRPTQIHWWFHCLLFIALLKLMTDSSKRRWAIIGGMALAGACLTYWFGGAATGLIAAIAYAIFACQNLNDWKKSLGNGAILSFIAIGICLTLTWRLSQKYLDGSNLELFQAVRAEPWIVWSFLGHQTPLSYVVHISSWNDFLSEISKIQYPWWIWWMWAFTLLPLGFKKRLPWILAGSLSLFIPFASIINFGDWWIPTSNAFLHGVFPPMERCGFPERLMVAPILCVGLSGALTLAEIESIMKKAPTWLFYVSSSIIAGWLGYQGLQGIPKSIPTSSLQPDNDVLQESALYPGGIIHVPVEEAGNAFVQQLFHKQPILTGPGADAVRPEEHIVYCQNNSLLQALESLAKESHPLLPAFLEDDRQRLLDDGFTLVQIDLRKSASSMDSYEALLGTTGLRRPNRHLLMLPLKKQSPQ